MLNTEQHHDGITGEIPESEQDFSERFKNALNEALCFPDNPNFSPSWGLARGMNAFANDTKISDEVVEYIVSTYGEGVEFILTNWNSLIKDDSFGSERRSEFGKIGLRSLSQIFLEKYTDPLDSLLAERSLRLLLLDLIDVDDAV